jgi:hypothetical protein
LKLIQLGEEYERLLWLTEVLIWHLSN